MRGVVNVTSSTVHKRAGAESRLSTQCGATKHVPNEQLRPASVEAMEREPGVSRCGRCFEDGGGY